MRAVALLHRLPHSAEPDQSSRQAAQKRRRPGRAAAIRAARLRLLTPSPATAPAAQQAPELLRAAAAATHVRDVAVVRARNAGGPIDNASYTCGCGYVFAASVSTTVACPHCGADQAW